MITALADILFTIKYTALSSFNYRQQVIQQFNRNISAERSFSFRNQFAVAWCDLHDPDQATSSPMTVYFNTVREDFPPNFEEMKIQHIVLYFTRADGKSFEVPVNLNYLPLTEYSNKESIGDAATSIDGIVSIRPPRGNVGSWISLYQ